MADALKKFSTAMGRATHKVMAKVGKAEDTQDPEYQFALERCINEGKKVKLIARHAEKLAELLHTSTVVMGEIADEFKGLYSDPTGLGAAPLAQYQNAVKEVEAARAAFDQELRAQLVAPLDAYHAQFEEIKRRSKILATRKTDMDRYHEKVLKLTDKTSGAKDGLPQADANYRAARDTYDQLRSEMMGDMPRLHDDMSKFLAPAIAVYCREVGRFGGAWGDVLRPLQPACARVETSVLHGWPQVITPPERTCAGAPAEATPAPAPAPAAAVPTASPPSSTMPTPAAPAAQQAVRTAPAPPPAAAPPLSPTAQQAKALFNFSAEDATELPLKKGDVVTVLGKQGDWWQCELAGRRGLVPANYLSTAL